MRFTSETDRPARRIGWSVLAILGVGLVSALLVAGIQWRDVRLWRLVGTFEDGIAGLRPGSVVRLGGAVMGQVTAIEIDRAVRPRESAPSEVPLPPSTGGFLVTFELDAEVELRTDAQIVLDQNALSGNAELDILSIGGQRSAPLPGTLDRSAQRAPIAPSRKPFTISSRGDAPTRILGRTGAGDLAAIQHHLPAFEQIFIGAAGTEVPDSTTTLGPEQQSRIMALRDAVRPLLDAVESDRAQWGRQLDSIRTKWSDLTASIAENEGQSPQLLRRITALRTAVDDETGLRAIWHQLTEAFTRPSSSWSTLSSCMGPMFEQASLLATTVTSLWPEIRDDLLITKTGFVIGVAELWIMTGPEVVTSVIRMFQPFTTEQQRAITIVLAANRVAGSAEALQAAIDASRGAMAEGGALMTPEATRHLEEVIRPALQRYRRDLDDMMKVLDAAAAASDRR